MSRPIGKIDAHQHFWKLDRGDYDWLTPDLEPLYRDFTPTDLAPLLKSHEIVGTVLVQAAPTLAETHYMLSLADDNPFIKGVVGWVDFEASDAPDQIQQLSTHSRLVGLRPMIQDIADDAWMLRPDLEPALQSLIDSNLAFDALTLPRHLKNLLRLLEKYPNMSVIVDHGSKPDIASGSLAGWADDIAALAKSTSAYCKLSGLVTEAAKSWSIDDLQPYADHLLETFGPSRLIWGSDWPVCKLAANYSDWVQASEHLLSGLSDADQHGIWYQNAITAYGLDI